MTRNVGKYQIVRHLATGGMAEVFLAKATGPRGFEKTLVLKCILPHLANESAFVEMFLFEAMLAARLTDPHIVQIFDLGEADGSYFLAMEYVDGPSLRALIKRASAQSLFLPPTLCARLISHACEGLAFAHDFVDEDTGQALGLIHRDVSPDNILLSMQGAVKVGDFGIAKAAGQVHKTKSGVIKGKISYMPPEQLRAQDMDRRADVYALGVVLYELLTLRKPYRASSEPGLMHCILFEPSIPPHQYRPDLPEAMQRILARAIAKDREQRYPDCHAFQADLEDFILATGKPVTARQVSQLIHQVLSVPGGLAPSGPPPPPAEPAPASTLVLPPSTPEAPKTVWLERGAASSEDAETCSEDMVAPVERPLPRLGTSLSDPTLLPTQARSNTRLSTWRRTAVLGGAALLSLLGGLAIWASTAPELPVREPLAAYIPPPPVAATRPPAPSAPSVTPVRQEPEVETPRDVEPPPPAVTPPSAGTASLTSARRSPDKRPRPPRLPVARSATQQPDAADEARATPKTLVTVDVVHPVTKPPASMGRLDIRSNTSVRVSVDGVNMGETPLERELELSPGEHKLIFTSKSFRESVKKDISIKAGETYRLKVVFLQMN